MMGATKWQSRRQFLKTAAAGAGVAAFGELATAAQGASPPPYVVLLISDDQGWQDYSFMGHPHIETPRIDRLAKESLTLTRGYVTAPLCCASLASILTGLHPHQHGITSNDPPVIPGKRGWPEERLESRAAYIANIDDDPKLPALLKQKDFRSLQTGKWWLGHHARGGFTHGMTHGDPERGGRHGDAGLTIGRETMQPLYDFIGEADEDPFFVWYAPMMPHLPHNPPERLLEKYRDKTASIHVARYWAMCEWWDETCGELLDHLSSQGLAENTIVLYICDNGWIQREDKPAMADRSKRTPYEGGIRTPIMMRWPGQVAPKTDTSTLASAVDLAPTILDACGMTPPARMQGLSLLDYERLQERDAVFGAAYSHDARDIYHPLANLNQLYVVSGDWKLIAPAGPDPKGEIELFHITRDPSEEHNLARRHPERVKDLLARLEAWWPEGAATIIR